MRPLAHSIRGLATRDGLVYASASNPRSGTTSLRVWRWPGGEVVHQQELGALFRELALSPDGRWLVLGERDRGRLWWVPLGEDGLPTAGE